MPLGRELRADLVAVPDSIEGRGAGVHQMRLSGTNAVTQELTFLSLNYFNAFQQVPCAVLGF